MSEANLDIHPRDEFRNKKQGFSPVLSSESAGFTDFETFQRRSSEGRVLEVYGVDKMQSRSPQERQDLFALEFSRFLSDMHLGPVPRDRDNRIDYDQDKHSKDRDFIDEKTFPAALRAWEIIGERFGRHDSIDSIAIKKWALRISRIDPVTRNKENYYIDLVRLLRYENGAYSIDERVLSEGLRVSTRAAMDALRDDLESESLFGGALVVSYERVSAVNNTAAHVAWGVLLASAVTGSLDTAIDTTYRIRSVMARDENGRMRRLDKSIVQKFASHIGDKTQLNTLLFRMMESSGKTFNVARNAFTSARLAAIDRSASAIAHMQYADSGLSREEFDRAKSDFVTRANKLAESWIDAFLRTGNQMLSGAKTVGKLWMHYLFWGVFFKEYHKNYADSVALYKWFAEMGAFYTGAKLGVHFGPKQWQWATGLAGGTLAAGGVQYLGSMEAVDKKLWKLLPERYAIDDTKSPIAHVALGWLMQEYSDMIGLDVSLTPGFGRGGWRIANPFGKDVVMPDIALAQTTIDFGTNPRDYLNARYFTASAEQWNKSVDEFVWTDAKQGFVVTEIQRILSEYYTHRWIFTDVNVCEQEDFRNPFSWPKQLDGHSMQERRKEVLRERLMRVIAGSNTNPRTRAIVEDAVEYVSGTIVDVSSPADRKKLLEMFFRNYGNILKIDTQTIADDKEIAERDVKYIASLRDDFIDKLSPELKQFAKTVFARLASGESLVRIVSSHGRSATEDDRVRKYDPVERALYDVLIDNPVPLTPEEYAHIWCITPEQQTGKTQGDYFVFLLSISAEHREQSMFIDRLAKNPDAIHGKLNPSEILKDIGEWLSSIKW